jgi:hypothetical protein
MHSTENVRIVKILSVWIFSGQVYMCTVLDFPPTPVNIFLRVGIPLWFEPRNCSPWNTSCNLRWTRFCLISSTVHSSQVARRTWFRTSTTVQVSPRVSMLWHSSFGQCFLTLQYFVFVIYFECTSFPAGMQICWLGFQGFLWGSGNPNPEPNFVGCSTLTTRIELAG